MGRSKNRKGADASGDAIKPRDPRYACSALVGIAGFEGQALLRNIGAAGCRMESKTYAALAPGERHVLRIQPEASSNIKPFEAEAEVRWIKSAETRFNAGFLIRGRPADKSFEKYLEHLKGRSSLA
jgi:hypothetical protein